MCPLDPPVVGLVQVCGMPLGPTHRIAEVSCTADSLCVDVVARRCTFATFLKLIKKGVIALSSIDCAQFL